MTMMIMTNDDYDDDDNDNYDDHNDDYDNDDYGDYGDDDDNDDDYDDDDGDDSRLLAYITISVQQPSNEGKLCMSRQKLRENSKRLFKLQKRAIQVTIRDTRTLLIFKPPN